jgi:hypothetical protein
MVLGLIILGARCLTVAQRSPPPVARPVRTVGVTFVLVPVVLIHLVLNPVVLISVLMVRGRQRLDAN